MFSPYHRAKEERGLVLPEVQSDALCAKRMWLALLTAVVTKQPEYKIVEAQENFLAKLHDAFPESVPELLEDIHAGLTRFQEHPEAPGAEIVARAALAVSARLIEGQEGVLAIPLLERLTVFFSASSNDELLAVAALNEGIASKALNAKRSDELKTHAVNLMPDDRWNAYPEILSTAAYVLQYQLRLFKEHGNFSAFLTAAELAERSYRILSRPPLKGSEVEVSANAIALLDAISEVAEAAEGEGRDIGLPPALQLFEQVSINAAAANDDGRLLVVSLLGLARHYLRSREPEEGIRKAHEKICEALVVALDVDEVRRVPLVKQLYDLFATLPNVGDE